MRYEFTQDLYELEIIFLKMVVLNVIIYHIFQKLVKKNFHVKINFVDLLCFEV